MWKTIRGPGGNPSCNRLNVETHCRQHQMSGLNLGWWRCEPAAIPVWHSGRSWCWIVNNMKSKRCRFEFLQTHNEQNISKGTGYPVWWIKLSKDYHANSWIFSRVWIIPKFLLMSMSKHKTTVKSSHIINQSQLLVLHDFTWFFEP